MKAIELLPGKHVLLVNYKDAILFSPLPQEVDIDTKGGENYLLSATTTNVGRGSFHPFHRPGNTEGPTWDAAIESFTPGEHDADNFERVLLEGKETVFGFIQSIETGKHGVIKSFLLSVHGETSPRIYKWGNTGDVYLRVNAGQRVRVTYFASTSGVADEVLVFR